MALFSLRREKFHKIFLLLCAMIIFHALVLMITASGEIYFGVLRFFTVLSNLLLGVAFAAKLVFYRRDYAFLRHLSFSAMIAIIVTSLVYNFVLIPFAGAETIFRSYANFVTHFLSMVLVLANYIFFESKGTFRYTHAFVGMIFPVVYWLTFVTELFYFYPYFFMNPPQIGWLSTILWFGVLAALFASISLGMVRLDSSKNAVKIFQYVYIALLGLSVKTAMVFVGGILLFLMLLSRPRTIQPHEIYFALENSTDIPTEGIIVEPGISLYVNLRGNSISFQIHESSYVLINYHLSSHTIHHQPVYEFTHDENGTWLRIADEIRSSGRGQFKNSSEPDGDITIFVPADATKVFYVIEIFGENMVRSWNSLPLREVAERVYLKGEE